MLRPSWPMMAALLLPGCGLSPTAPVELPLHDIEVVETATDRAPIDLTVTRLEGKDGPAPGDTWRLLAEARDPEGGAVQYLWQVSSGELSAREGAEITWTATEAVGRVVISVTATDASGQAVGATVALRVEASAATGPLSDEYDSWGWFCTLAMDGEDHPHVAFWDETHPSVWYAAWNGASWDRQMVEGYGLGVGGNAGYLPSLAVDAEGDPHLAWFSYYKNAAGTSETRVLNYGAKVGASWAIASLGECHNSASFPISLALDPRDGHPEILYMSADRTQARLAVCTGDCTSAASWRHSTVYQESRSQSGASDNRAFPGGFLIDEAGVRHVTVGYEYNAGGYQAGLYYFKDSGAGFGAPELISTVNDNLRVDQHAARLALDANGQPLALVQQGIWQRSSGGSWRIWPYATASGDISFRFDLATDPERTPPASGRVFFTYPHGTALELVETDDRGYFVYTYIGSIASSTNARTGLALDSAGAPHLCWAQSGALQYR